MDELDQLLKEGIAAARAKQNETAQKLLVKALRLAPNNETAWLWLSAVVDGRKAKLVCLNRVLEINPRNSAARRGLEVLTTGTEVRQPAAAGNGQKPRGQTTTEQPETPMLHTSARETDLRRESPVRSARSMTPPSSQPAQAGGRVFGCLVLILMTALILVFGEFDLPSSSPRKTSTPAASAYEREQAIRKVQQYEVYEGTPLIDSMALGLVYLSSQGYSVDSIGWSASKDNSRWVVNFAFRQDGKRVEATWWYVPTSGLVVPKNDWAEAFMGY